MEIMDERKGIIRTAKRAFSRIGIAGVVMMGVLLVMQSVMMAMQLFMPENEFFKSELYMALSRTVPMYIFAMPAAFLVMLSMKTVAPERHSLSVSQFFVYFLIGWFFMQAGAVASNIMSMMIDAVTGVSSSDVLNEAIGNMTLLESFISLCILAPLGEEFIFRKIIVDRARRFGEGPAIFASALIFSLFHTNINQFIYAFLLGALFAYIYIRHGNIWHTVLLHSAVNFMGGMIPTLLERIKVPSLEMPFSMGESMELAAQFDLGALGLATIPMALFGMLSTGLAVVGVVMFIRNVRKVRLMPMEGGLVKGEYVSAILRNPGMIIYMVVTLIITVLVYIAMI